MTALSHPTMGETASCPTAPNKSATWPWQATPAPAKPRCSKPCCMPAARSRRQARVERGSTVSDFDPIEKAARPLASTPRIASIDHGRHPRQPDRHARLSRISAARRCPRSPRWKPCDRGRCRHRHRVRHAPDDGVRQGAQAVPRARRQQDRPRRRRQPRALLDELREAFGPEVPAAQPARRRRQERGRLLLATRAATATWARSPTGTRRSSTRSSRSTRR